MLSNALKRIGTLSKSWNPALSAVRNKAAYEGEGKTTVRVLNQELDLGLMIDTYATYGFKLNNGLTVLGPMAIFPRTVLSWQVTSAEELNEDSLRLFTMLEPKIDLLILGLDTESRTAAGRALNLARSLSLNVEVLTTEHACSTFNFLNAEGRCVAAALIPPSHIRNMTEDDMMETKLHYQDVFNKPLA